MGRQAQNSRILFSLFLVLNVSLVKNIKTKKQKNKTKQSKHKKHLSSSDPDHVVKREGSLNMSRHEKTK
jgi:hypothetical protein